MIKAGTYLVMCSGSYSEHSVDGIAKTLKDFDEQEAHERHEMEGGPLNFYAWLIDRKYIEDLEGSEWETLHWDYTTDSFKPWWGVNK